MSSDIKQFETIDELVEVHETGIYSHMNIYDYLFSFDPHLIRSVLTSKTNTPSKYDLDIIAACNKSRDKLVKKHFISDVNRDSLIRTHDDILEFYKNRKVS